MSSSGYAGASLTGKLISVSTSNGVNRLRQATTYTEVLFRESCDPF